MLNYETLLSSYDDKLTLMQWLKKVEDALKNASAVAFNVNKRGDATLTFSVVFEDGTELETGPIVLEQGESVASAAIVGGHLKLTLSNGDVLDAGDLGGVSSFSIDASQHLIVHYQNGTTQDLGAIFSGNVTIDGDLSVTGNIATDSMTPKTGSAITIDGDLDVSDGNISLNDGAVSTPILTSPNSSIEAQKPVIENMTGYTATFRDLTASNLTIEGVYAGVSKNGNKLSIVLAFNVTRTDDATDDAKTFAEITMPASIGANLYTTPIGGSNILLADIMHLTAQVYSDGTNKPYGIWKQSNSRIDYSCFNLSNLPLNTKLYCRIETTFLLSENLIS